jgi:hypothetical protein
VADRHVYHVQLSTGFQERQRAWGLVFESRHPTIGGIVEELQQFGIVHGFRLRVTDDGNGGRLIRARDEMAIGVAGLSTIQPFEFPVREPEA